MLTDDPRSQRVCAEMLSTEQGEGRAVGRMVLSDGALVEIPFEVLALSTNPQFRITRVGPSVLVAGGQRAELPAKPAPPLGSPPPAKPAPAAASSAMWLADQRELAARHKAHIRLKPNRTAGSR